MRYPEGHIFTAELVKQLNLKTERFTDDSSIFKLYVREKMMNVSNLGDIEGRRDVLATFLVPESGKAPNLVFDDFFKEACRQPISLTLLLCLK